MKNPLTKHDQFFLRLVHDEAFWVEALCSVADLRTTAVIPFKHNNAQWRYQREIRNKGAKRDIVGKSRKWGFSCKRLAGGLHGAMYTPNRIFRIVAHKEATNKETLRPMLWQLYESGWNALKDEYGVDPSQYMPRVTNGNGYGTESVIEFGEIGSKVVFSTAAGAGVGQAERSDDLYLTEYADWEHAAYVYSKLAGSQPKGNPGTRCTIDFNADGVTNDAYLKYTRAKLDHDDPDWNGFTPFFAGIDDVPEYYPPAEMDLERRALGDKRFREVYPRNDEEMWVASQTSVFDHEHLAEAFSKGRAMGYQPLAPYRVHIVDTASGNPGGDFQTCTSWGLVDDTWVEASKPIRGHWPEDVFAVMVAERCHADPGLCLVERNVGSAVLVKLREEGVPNLYRHRHRDRTGKQYTQLGFPMTFSTKRTGITGAQRMLREGELAIVTPELHTEMREYEWKVKDNAAQDERSEVAGAPDREGAHDDLAVTVIMLAHAVEVLEKQMVPAVQMRG